MNCRCARASIEKDVLGLLTPGEHDALHAHASNCAACRDALAATQTLANRFQNAFAVSPPDERSLVKLRWHVQCEETQLQRASRRWAAVRRFGRLAACLAIALGAAWLAWSQISRASHTDCACHTWQLAGIQPVDAGGLALPLVCGQRVYAMQRTGKTVQLVAVNRHTGEYLWRASAAFEGGPAANESRVFAWVRGKDGSRQLAAYDAASGREAWCQPCPDTSRVVRPREIVADAHGVGWADRDQVTWLDARNGHRKWDVQLDKSDTLRPKLTVGTGCLIVVDAQQVCALSMARGAVLWSQKLEAGIANWVGPRVSTDGSSLAIARTIGPKIERLSCFDLRTGQEIWTRDAASQSLHLLFQDGMLFVRGQALTAIDGRTGNQLWSLRADGCSPVTLADGKLYLMEGANGVFAVDPATGATLWRNGDLASCSGLAVSGRMGYVRTTDGVLHAIRLMDDPARAKEQQADCRKDARRVVQRLS